jgi:polysulfide reductase chain C
LDGLIVDNEKINPLVKTKYMKPQEPWGWQIAVYLFLAGMGAGSFAIGTLMDWLGLSDELPNTAILIWGVVLVAIGTMFLVLDLGIKTRALNVVFNIRTSWLSRGFLILSGCIGIGVLTVAAALLPLLGITVPLIIFRLLQAAGVVFSLGTAAYTGILLRATKYITLWNTWWLPTLFLASALSTGSMLVFLSVHTYSIFFNAVGNTQHLLETITRAEQIAVIFEAIVLGLFLFLRYRTPVQGARSVAKLLSGNLKYLFWIGIVVLGFFFPTILESFYSVSPVLPFVAGLCLLTAGFLLRFGVLRAGIKEQPPVSKLIVIPESYKKNLEHRKPA